MPPDKNSLLLVQLTHFPIFLLFFVDTRILFFHFIDGSKPAPIDRNSDRAGWIEDFPGTDCARILLFLPRRYKSERTNRLIAFESIRRPASVNGDNRRNDGYPETL